MSPYEYEIFEIMMRYGGGFLLLCLLALAAYATSCPMLGLAAYNDARAKCNRNATMWGLLVGLLGLVFPGNLVAGIVYLCVRNSGQNRPVYCMNCRFPYAAQLPNCPQCGAPNPFGLPPYDVNAPLYAKRAKRDLIIGLVALGVFVLAIIGFFALFFSLAFELAGTEQFSSAYNEIYNDIYSEFYHEMY